MDMVSSAFMDKYDKLINHIEKKNGTRHGLLDRTKSALRLILLVIENKGKDVLIRDIVAETSIDVQRVQKLIYILLSDDAISKKEMQHVFSKKKPIYGYTINYKHPLLKE